MRYHLHLDPNTMTKPWRKLFDGIASNWQLRDGDTKREHWTCDVQDKAAFMKITKTDPQVQEVKADG